MTDLAMFMGPGGTVSGTATYAALNVTHANPASWTFTGAVGAATASITGLATVASGGRVTVGNPAAPTTYSLQIGTTLAGGASATVTGAGSVLDSSQYGAYIGGIAGGSGSLTVSNGGVARFGTINLPNLASLSLGQLGTGSIAVNGIGSTLKLAGGFYAGRASGPRAHSL